MQGSPTIPQRPLYSTGMYLSPCRNAKLSLVKRIKVSTHDFKASRTSGNALSDAVSFVERHAVERCSDMWKYYFERRAIYGQPVYQCTAEWCQHHWQCACCHHSKYNGL